MVMQSDDAGINNAVGHLGSAPTFAGNWPPGRDFPPKLVPDSVGVTPGRFLFAFAGGLHSNRFVVKPFELTV